MEIYSELLKLAPLILSGSTKRESLIKMAELSKDLEKSLKCPPNPHIKFALQLELAGQPVDYTETIKEILMYYKPFLSIHTIIMNIYSNIIKQIDNKEENNRIMEDMFAVQQESQIRSEIRALQTSNDKLDHFLDTQYTDTLSRKSSLNPYQLRYTIAQYKEKKIVSEKLKRKMDENSQLLESKLSNWKKEREKLDQDRHKDHVDKLIEIYQKTNTSRVPLKNLEEDDDIEKTISVHLVDPHATPSPKLIQRFSFSMPEDPVFTDVMDELQIVNATDSIGKTANPRQQSINHLEEYLEFRKADIGSIPEHDMHLELITKSNTNNK